MKKIVVFSILAVIAVALIVVGRSYMGKTQDPDAVVASVYSAMPADVSAVSSAVASVYIPTSSAASSLPASSAAASSQPVSSQQTSSAQTDARLEQYIDKVIEIALEQPQYPVENGKTVYGALFGTPYSQWCTEFVMYCLKNAEDALGTDFIGDVYPWRDSAYATGLWFKRQNRYYDAGGDYLPSRGDLIIFDSQELGYPNHIGLVTGVVTENGRTYIVTIEGNIPEDDVKQVRSRKLLPSDPIIMAYCSTTQVTPYEGSLTDYS